MSQVIVTNDSLNKERDRSREQEHRISREEEFAKWRLPSDVTKPSPVLKLLGLASLPILLLWSFLTGMLSVAIFLAMGLFRVFGALIGRQKSFP